MVLTLYPVIKGKPSSIARLRREFGGHLPISSKNALDPSRWFKVIHIMHSKWTYNHFPTKFVALGQSVTKLPKMSHGRGTFLVYTNSSLIEIMYPHLILLLRVIHAFWSLWNKFQVDIYFSFWFMGPFIMTSSQAEPEMSPISRYVLGYIVRTVWPRAINLVEKWSPGHVEQDRINQ